jgi:hypothetical protein
VKVPRRRHRHSRWAGALGGEATASDWAAELTAMTVGWGIGLAVYAFGAVHTRGFDDVAAA